MRECTDMKSRDQIEKLMQLWISRKTRYSDAGRAARKSVRRLALCENLHAVRVWNSPEHRNLTKQLIEPWMKANHVDENKYVDLEMALDGGEAREALRKYISE